MSATTATANSRNWTLTNGQMTINNGVTSIGDFAFTGNTTITSVTIHAGVIYIGLWAFHYNPLTSVTFEGDNVQWDRNNNWDIPRFVGNLQDVHSGRGTYVRGSDGNWTKQ